VARITKLYADRDARSQDEIRLKDGRVLDRITGPVKLADGTYIGRVWFFRDVSERARIQEQLQTVHERLQSATEGAAAGVWEIDWETQKMKWDATTRELYALSGTDPDPDVGSWLARVHGDDRSSIREKLSAAAADEADRFDAEFRVPLPDGTVRWLRSFGRIFRDRYGVALRATGICLDITAAKRIEADKDRAEASLAASERRFRAMIENAGDIILVADSRALLTYVSPSIEAVAGYTPGEMLGHSILEYVDPAGREALKAKYAAIAAQPNLIDRNERPYLHKGGEQRIYEVVSSNLLHDPAVAGIVVNLRDISERKEAEARLHAVTGAAMDAVILVDNEGKLAFWNDAAERILGYKSAEIIGKDFHSLLAPARYLEAFHAGFAAFRATGRGPAVGKTTELAARRQDGTEIPVELSLASVILKGKWNAVGILRDISARKVQEEALARVNRTLKTLSACNSVVVHATTEQQLLQDMCRTVVEIGGFKAAWIGFAQQDREKSVRPVAWAGATENYVGQLDINWDDTERGRGPVGRCIRTAAPQVIHDIEADPLMAPWHTLTEEHGYLSSLTLPLTGPAGVFGALMIDAGERDAFGANELELLSEMASDLSYGIMALRTVAAHAEGLHRLELSMEGTIHALAGMVETRDPYTAGHQRRVTALAVAIAREMDLSDHAVRGLELAATIHDIGKINVPAEILAKPGKLTPIEFELIKTHPETGHEILKDVQFPWPVAEIIRQHHERSDGSGYPRGLRSEQILPEAKILAVADVAEAMSSHRPYRPGKGVGAALEEIARGRGTVFDAAVVDACLRLFHERGYKIPE
jgi:PAS domain S-box-containing protein/putative nucleotidyltransferase with HDIG domain